MFLTNKTAHPVMLTLFLNKAGKEKVFLDPLRVSWLDLKINKDRLSDERRTRLFYIQILCDLGALIGLP